MDQDLLISVSVLGSAVGVLLIITIVLWVQVSGLKKKVLELQAAGRIRVQKLRMEEDKNHAFHNPGLVPDEELSRRGYSLYAGHEDRDRDVESGRGSERQTGGQFVAELSREIENRQQRNTAPPFLLQSIQESRKKSRSLNNPVTNGRQSDTNPNFIY